jgi:hypothetical protein
MDMFIKSEQKLITFASEGLCVVSFVQNFIQYSSGMFNTILDWN